MNNDRQSIFRQIHFYSSLLFLLFTISCQKPEEKTFKPFATVNTFFGTRDKIGEPFGIALKNGALFVSDGEAGRILQINRDGTHSVLTDKLDTPSQIAFDGVGDLIVADAGSHTIKRVKPGGEIELVAGRENEPGFADGEAKSALFRAPVGVAVRENKIYVADSYNDRIRVIENGAVSTLAGSSQGFADGAGGAAKFDTPAGIAVNSAGKIFVADSNNGRLRVVEPDGATWTLIGNGASEPLDGTLAEAGLFQPLAISINNSGAIYFTDGNAVRVIENQIFPFVRTISSERRGYADGALPLARFNRPSGLAADENGNLFVADAENQSIRVFTGNETGVTLSGEEIEKSRPTAEQFRSLAPPRWSYNPPEKVREIAGTLGEIRGEMTDANEQVWFHNGLDIVGGYGETARFVRSEKVLRLRAAENFNTLRELLRLPTLGYIHIRLGRDQTDKIFDDARFLFSRDASGKINGVRVPRGTRFEAGDAVGTLNAMNHVHLVAGRSGAEMNALDALALPGASDKIPPVIEEIALFDENWRSLETQNQNARINLHGKTRVVVRAYDRMDGNAERRRLGVFRLGFQIFKDDQTPVAGEPDWTIRFDRLPEPEAVRLVYADGSKSGATGETIFKYIVTNKVRGNVAAEDFFDAAPLANGNYILRVFAADYFGNTAQKDLNFSINK